MQTKPNSFATSLPAYPILPPGYELIPMPDGAINLRRWQRSVVLRGQAAQLAGRLIGAMDGHRDLTQLADTTRLPSKLLIQILTRLKQADLLVDSRQLLADNHQHFGVATSLSVFSQEPGHDTYRQLQQQTVFVVGDDELSPAVGQNLRHNGIGQTKSLTSAEVADDKLVDSDFLIHVQRRPDYKTACLLNEIALQQNINWLSAWVEGRSLVVSHVMMPGENACFECLLLRQRANYQNLAADLAYENHLRQPPDDLDLHIQESLPALDLILNGLVTLRAVDYLGGWRPGPPVPKLLEFSTSYLENIQHPVLRLPHCPVCGPATLQQKVNPFVSEVVPTSLESLP
jgi:bacteriocin biosynthesis cyclodehydratase domain-containing protein